MVKGRGFVALVHVGACGPFHQNPQGIGMVVSHECEMVRWMDLKRWRDVCVFLARSVLQPVLTKLPHLTGLGTNSLF